MLVPRQQYSRELKNSCDAGDRLRKAKYLLTGCLTPGGKRNNTLQEILTPHCDAGPRPPSLCKGRCDQDGAPSGSDVPGAPLLASFARSGRTTPSPNSLRALSIFDNLATLSKSSSTTMNINLTPQLEQLVRRRFPRDVTPPRGGSRALRLMEEQDRLRAVKLKQLWRDIREGLEGGPATSWNVEEMKRGGRKQLAARRASHLENRAHTQMSGDHSQIPARTA